MATIQEAVQAARRRSCKQADIVGRIGKAFNWSPTVPDFSAASDAAKALQEQVSSHQKDRLLKMLAATAMTAGGVGMAGRGAYGLLSQADRNLRPRSPSSVIPTTVEVPVKERDKQAEFSFKDLFKGDYARSIAGIPAAIPALAATGAAGAMGGWKLQDWLLDQRRREEMDAELERAKKEYTRALTKQSGSELGEALDELYDEVEKTASVGDAAGIGLGALGLYALLSGSAGFSGGLTAGKKKQRRRLLEQAQKLRRRQRFAKRPSVILAKSVPMRSPEPIEKTDPFQAAPSLNETEDRLGIA